MLRAEFIFSPRDAYKDRHHGAKKPIKSDRNPEKTLF